MTPESVFAQIADRPGAVWLDGGRTGRAVIAWDPAEILVDGADWPAAGRSLTRASPRGPGFFGSGVIGWVGYGAGHRVEAVPAQAPTPEPELWLARYEGALCWDNGWTISGPAPFRREAERLIAAAPPPPPAPPPVLAARSVSRAAFEASVRQIQAWIAEGDCYQINLTRAIHVDGADRPIDIYRRLRAASDASHGAMIAVDASLAVLSNSPESLLDVRGRTLRAEPIKGTRPRGGSPDEDARLRAELDASPKERAELAMIVDLVRNDLGRVARAGSVRAGERVLRAHATVHHASWPVHAELAPGRDAWDALAALFPPGSVIGAPKIRAAHRIESLETHPRGAYCGAVGYAADGGDASWSVAIRTAIWHGGAVRFHVGGGIVADSDAAAEWEETEHKAAALRAAIGAPRR